MPELRKDPVLGRWVIIADERGRRPSDFPQPQPPREGGLCPFCPGNEGRTPPEILAHRAPGSAANHAGWTLRVVPNLFPALRIEGDVGRSGDGLYDRMNGLGAHEVIVESPDHQESLATMRPERLQAVLSAWRERIADLRKDSRLRHVLVFKNHRAPAGATLSHSHSQLMALPLVPTLPAAAVAGAAAHFARTERCVYCDILRQEKRDNVRVVHENERFVVFCPFASSRAFESWIVPRNHEASFELGPADALPSLADALGTLLRKLDRALEAPPWNLTLQTAPLRDAPSASFHWHLQVTPALGKLAGFELGTGCFINPTAPEEAAAFLRDVEG